MLYAGDLNALRIKVRKTFFVFLMIMNSKLVFSKRQIMIQEVWAWYSSPSINVDNVKEENTIFHFDLWELLDIQELAVINYLLRKLVTNMKPTSISFYSIFLHIQIYHHIHHATSISIHFSTLKIHIADHRSQVTDAKNPNSIIPVNLF